MQVWKKLACAGAGLVLVPLLVATLSAQDKNPNMLDLIRSLQATVEGLVSTVGSLVTTVNHIDAATREGNALYTPSLVAIPPDTLTCTATNVNAAARWVNVQLFNGNTGVLLVEAASSVDTAHTTGVSVGGGVRAFCKVTVTDGIKNDVRAVMTLQGLTLSDREPIAAQ